MIDLPRLGTTAVVLAVVVTVYGLVADMVRERRPADSTQVAAI